MHALGASTPPHADGQGGPKEAPQGGPSRGGAGAGAGAGRPSGRARRSRVCLFATLVGNPRKGKQNKTANKTRRFCFALACTHIPASPRRGAPGSAPSRPLLGGSRRQPSKGETKQDREPSLAHTSPPRRGGAPEACGAGLRVPPAPRITRGASMARAWRSHALASLHAVSDAGTAIHYFCYYYYYY